MLWYKCITLMIIVLLFPAVVSAEIVINEVYPAPKDGEFEWIELYNPSAAGWILRGGLLMMIMERQFML